MNDYSECKMAFRAHFTSLSAQCILHIKRGIGMGQIYEEWDLIL